MRSIVSHLIAACSIFGVTAGFADVIFSVDLDLSTDGIQSNISVVNGATITGAVVLEVTGASRFSAYDVVLDFDQANLAFGPNTLSGLTDNGLGSRVTPVATNRVNLGASGTLMGGVAFVLGPLTDDDPVSAPMPDLDPVVNSFTGIAGGTSGEPLGSPIFDFSSLSFVDFNKPVYNFTLTAMGSGTPMFTLRPGVTAFLGATDLGVVSYLGAQATITAVPEPSTWAVTGLGLLYFSRRRLRRQKTAATETAA